MTRWKKALPVVVTWCVLLAGHAAAAPSSLASQALQNYFSASDVKAIDDAVNMLDEQHGVLSIADYSCHSRMNRTVARQYLNSSSKWYSLMRRSLGDVVEAGRHFAGTFVDAGFMPPSASPKVWNFLTNSIVMGELTSFGQFKDLDLHMPFPSNLSPFATTFVNEVFDMMCDARNASVATDLFAPSATFDFITSTRVHGPGNGVESEPVFSRTQFPTLAAFQQAFGSFFAERSKCAFMIRSLVSGCDRISVAHSELWEVGVGLNQTIEHGFSRFTFEPSQAESRTPRATHWRLLLDVAVAAS